MVCFNTLKYRFNLNFSDFKKKGGVIVKFCDNRITTDGICIKKRTLLPATKPRTASNLKIEIKQLLCIIETLNSNGHYTREEVEKFV